MREPLVCAVLLTCDHPEMARRAIRSFRAQTYERKIMLVWDTGEQTCSEYSDGHEDDTRHLWPDLKGASIGTLRNYANQYAAHHYTTNDTRPEIFVHWKDRDWSHPNRIAEQVGLLQSSGADCVGYRSLVCWREKECAFCADPEGVAGAHCSCGDGQAWRYSHPSPYYALGASLCYWRETWWQRPFQDISTGEDAKFIEGRRMSTENGMECGAQCAAFGPAMIVGIGDPSAEPACGLGHWQRLKEWDALCRERMTL